jgi:tRNA 2-thiouridine synthesizing protein A
MADATLDAGAENCGRLIALVVDAMADLMPGQTLVVTAYDPSSQVDLAAWCRMTGHTIWLVVPVADRLEFVIEKTQHAKEALDGTCHDP